MKTQDEIWQKGLKSQGKPRLVASLTTRLLDDVLELLELSLGSEERTQLEKGRIKKRVESAWLKNFPMRFRKERWPGRNGRG